MATVTDKIEHKRPLIQLSGHIVAEITIIFVVISLWWGGMFGRLLFLFTTAVIWVWVWFARGEDILKNSFWLNLLKCNRKDVCPKVVFRVLSTLLLFLASFLVISSISIHRNVNHEWRAFIWLNLEEKQVQGFSALSDERLIFSSETECLDYLAQIRQNNQMVLVECAADCNTRDFKYNCQISQ